MFELCWALSSSRPKPASLDSRDKLLIRDLCSINSEALKIDRYHVVWSTWEYGSQSCRLPMLKGGINRCLESLPIVYECSLDQVGFFRREVRGADVDGVDNIISSGSAGVIFLVVKIVDEKKNSVPETIHISQVGQRNRMRQSRFHAALGLGTFAFVLALGFGHLYVERYCLERGIAAFEIRWRVREQRNSL